MSEGSAGDKGGGDDGEAPLPPLPPSAPVAVGSEEHNEGGDDERRWVSLPAAWDMQDRKRSVVLGGRGSGMWRRTLHRQCKTWKARPGRIFDEKSTPFVAEGALEQVCGMDPMKGTRWPQQTAEEFAKREPQYAGYLRERTDLTQRVVGEEDPLSRTLAAEAGFEESEDSSDDGGNMEVPDAAAAAADDDDGEKKNVVGLFKVAKRPRIRIVDEESVEVQEEDHIEDPVEPELLGCAKRILAAEGTSMTEIGKDNVLDACRSVKSIMDAVHERLIRKTMEQDSAHEGKVMDSRDVLNVAAEVMLGNANVKYPALTLSEARARTAHVRSIMESLQVTDLTAMLNEVKNEPSLKVPTSESVRYLPTLCASEDDEKKDDEEVVHAGAKNKNHILQHMPPRLATLVRCQADISRFASPDNTPEVWERVRKQQETTLKLENIVRRKRSVTLRHYARKRAERKRRRRSASAQDDAP